MQRSWPYKAILKSVKARMFLWKTLGDTEEDVRAACVFAWKTQSEFFQLKINMYLNCWFGRALGEGGRQVCVQRSHREGRRATTMQRGRGNIVKLTSKVSAVIC